MYIYLIFTSVKVAIGTLKIHLIPAVTLCQGTVGQLKSFGNLNNP